MPGICGFFNVHSEPEAAPLAEKMFSRLRLPECQFTSQRVHPSGRFALALASLAVPPTGPQPVLRWDGRFHVVMDGELYNKDQICSHPEPSAPPLFHDDDAAVLSARYASSGIDAISRFEGSFAAAIVDASEHTLSLVSDRFGTRPIYYAHSANRFAFASTINSLLADPEIPRGFDWQGLSQFFTFGHYFNDNTSLDAVKLLPAGAVLVFHAKQNRISVHRYWHGSQRIAVRPRGRQEAFAAVEDALVQSVRRQQSVGGARVGLSLSGGLDARTILGTFGHRSSNLVTVCMGMRGSCDHETSTRLASIIGCEHHNHILDTAFLGEFGRHLENMVQLTDGQYLSQCIVMPTLPLYKRLGISVLMRGHAGELMHMSKAYNYSLDAAALSLRNDADLENWLWGRLTSYIYDGSNGALFARSGGNQIEAARESLRKALNDTPQTETPAARISHLFLDQRVRRETMLSLMKFRSVTEPRLPYLDRVLVEQLLAMPAEWRMDDELQTYILQKRQPQFCQVQNTNTGAPMGATKFRRQYAHLKMRVFAKLGMPGYQPYERLGLWLRRDLAALVRTTLLNDRCLDRGVFNPDTVRTVVERHLANHQNHTYLIMALLIFEVGHRWLLDDESFNAGHDRLQLAAVR